MEMTAITKIVSQSTVATEIDGYTIATEPPVSAGGSGQFPPATRMVIASLLNCTFSGLKAFCVKRDIPVDELKMEFKGNVEDGIYTSMELAITLPAEFPEKYKASIGNIIDTCAVKKIIRNLPEPTFTIC